MTTFSTSAKFAAVTVLLLLTACSTNKPPPAGTGMSSENIVPGSKRDFEVNVGDRVFYDFDKSDLKPEARRTIERWAAWMKQYPNVTVTVEGHCDERGTREYNLGLGDRRANAAKNFLVSLGVEARRVATISYGKERPAVLGSNDAAYAQNRRGVMVVN